MQEYLFSFGFQWCPEIFFGDFVIDEMDAVGNQSSDFFFDHLFFAS